MTTFSSWDKTNIDYYDIDIMIIKYNLYKKELLTTLLD